MPRKNLKPSRQRSIDFDYYVKLVVDLRNSRAAWPIDEAEEDRILDQMDVVWLRLSEKDQDRVEKRFLGRGK